MATILIDPIDIQTANGSNAQIIGIDITDTDCLQGTINGTRVRWDENGTCRNQTSGQNIDPRNSDVVEVLNTINVLKQ